MKVKFLPSGKICDLNPGESLLAVAHQNGLYIKSVCGGRASCAECRVRIVEGDAHCLPPSSAELALVGSGYFIDHRRLACQIKCVGDIVVDLSEQIEKEKRLKGVKTDRAEAQSIRQQSDETD